MADENNNSTGREYIVLMRVPEGDLRQVATVAASGPGQAARRAADKLDETMLEQGVDLIAIPDRNWAEVRIKLQRSSRLVTS